MRHLIVAEDNALDVERLRRQLRKLGRSAGFLQADNGDDALRALQEHVETSNEPLTLLADLNMPGLSGWELIEAVRADRRFAAVSIFVCTTSTHPRDRTQAAELRVDGYIVKPVQAEDLLEPLGLDAEATP